MMSNIQSMLLEFSDVQPINQLLKVVDGWSEGGEVEIGELVERELDVVDRLFEYFVREITKGYVPVNMYESLEGQTQKMEANNRTQIKFQEEMRVYIEELQNKVHKYERYINKKQHHILDSLREEIQLLRNRQTIIYEEKKSLLQANQELQLQNQQLLQQLSSLQHLIRDNPKNILDNTSTNNTENITVFIEQCNRLNQKLSPKPIKIEESQIYESKFASSRSSCEAKHHTG